MSGLAVTASVPCFNANRYVCRAVESLLAQSHRDLTVVVVNDGAANPPWAELAHIRDPRLVRYSLARNHGPYFVHQVVLGASVTPYFLIQDADDWSASNRVSMLLDRLLQDGSDLAFSAFQWYRQGDDGVLRPDSIRWRRKDRRDAERAPEPFVFDPQLTEAFAYRASHHGVFRRAALERIGGYYGGFSMNYDMLLTNLLLMTGKISFVEAPLYNYVWRRDSLCHSQATGARSPARLRVKEQQATIYRGAWQAYQAWMRQEVTSAEFTGQIRSLATRFVTAEARAELQAETLRLAAIMREPAPRR
jgi:glycosyltransferase involved in cell wall biosynthesis